jgi:glucose-1-phosphate thymidylyltransferase
MPTLFYLTESSPELAPLTETRPQGLLPVAGDAVLAHVLDLYRPLLESPTHLILSDHAAAVQTWLAERFPPLAEQTSVAPAPAGSLAGVVSLARRLDPDQPLLLLPGDAIIKVAWDARPDGAEALLWTSEKPDAPLGSVVVHEDGLVAAVGDAGQALTGALWVSRAALLFDHLPEDGSLRGLALSWIQAGIALYGAAADEWEQVTTRQQLLHANKRLLSVGYGTREALERSFAEGFGVIPPVYLADSAEVSGAIIGPYVSIGPGCAIRDGVLSNAIIGAGTTVERAILDEAVVGESSRVTGRSHALFTGDHATVDLG